MQKLKTYVFLILAVVLVMACNPGALASQTDPTSSALNSGVGQTYAATSTITDMPSQGDGPSQNGRSAAPAEPQGDQPAEAELEINPEESFPLAPDTQWDAGNGGSEEAENSGAFSLHSKATIEVLDQFYQAALASQGWTLRYSEANHGGGLSQYWKQDMLYMSLDFVYERSGLAIQVKWHQVDQEYLQMMPKTIPLPDGAEIVYATDSTWEFYIPLEITVASEYYQQKAAMLNWKPGSVPEGTELVCSGDCLNQAVPYYPPGITPVPTSTPDPRQAQVFFYTMVSGDEILLELQPQGEATLLNIIVTLKNVASAGLPNEVPIPAEATDMVIAPEMVRFTLSWDLDTTVKFYSDALFEAGWSSFAGYSLDTPTLYFQEWDKEEQSFRLNISTADATVKSSMVSIQCIECIAP
jgi:hypothetical protein